MLLWRRTTETNWRCSIETRRWLSRCCHDVLLPGGDLPLANFNNDDINLIIDILIAGDFYWSFFSGNIQKGRTSPIAFRNNIRVSIERQCWCFTF